MSDRTKIPWPTPPSTSGTYVHGRLTQVPEVLRTAVSPHGWVSTSTGRSCTPRPTAGTSPCTLAKPRRIFVNSMSDTLHQQVPAETIARVWALAAVCPRHQFLVLTKRHGRLASVLGAEATAFHTLVLAELDRMKAGHYGPAAQRAAGRLPRCRTGQSATSGSGSRSRTSTGPTFAYPRYSTQRRPSGSCQWNRWSAPSGWPRSGWNWNCRPSAPTGPAAFPASTRSSSVESLARSATQRWPSSTLPGRAPAGPGPQA